MSVQLLAVYRDESLYAATDAGVMYCDIQVSKSEACYFLTVLLVQW